MTIGITRLEPRSIVVGGLYVQDLKSIFSEKAGFGNRFGKKELGIQNLEISLSGTFESEVCAGRRLRGRMDGGPNNEKEGTTRGSRF